MLATAPAKRNKEKGHSYQNAHLPVDTTESLIVYGEVPYNPLALDISCEHVGFAFCLLRLNHLSRHRGQSHHPPHQISLPPHIRLQEHAL